MGDLPLRNSLPNSPTSQTASGARQQRGHPDRSPVRTEHRPPLDIAAAAEYCGTSERHLRRLVFERRIPFIRLANTRIRFLPDDLDDWLRAQRVEAVQ
jgi:excisionase family DNA binding protein